MKPAFVVGGLYHRANGVAWIMRDLAAAMGRAGSPVSVYAAECPRAGLDSIGSIFQPPSTWIGRPGRWWGGLSWSPKLREILERDIGQLDVIHNHSLWMLPNSYASQLGRRTGKPVLFTIHGTLEPWALSHSRWKKQIVGRWFQFRDLRSANCLHVNSLRELQSVRAAGFGNPVAVIPNGINLPEFESLPERTVFFRSHPQLVGKKLLLFMARLHKKKGLDHLLQSWAVLAGEFTDWHLVIAGPDDGYQKSCEEMIARSGIGGSTTLVGSLHDQDKLAALHAADIFVQPSHSEGFSMSVIEAMACKLPVLISHGCNFPEAAQAGAGIEVTADCAGTIAGLRWLMKISTSDRRKMGESGKNLVQRDYTWDRVAESMLQVYRWLKSEDARPMCVSTYGR